jgi:hypothetical protein
VTESTRDDASTSALTYSSGAGGPALTSMYQSNMFDPLFSGLFAAAPPPAPSYPWLQPPGAVSAAVPAPAAAAPYPVAPHVRPAEHVGPQLGEIIFGFAEYGQHPSPPAPTPMPAPAPAMYVDGFTAYGYAPEAVRGELDEYSAPCPRVCARVR